MTVRAAFMTHYPRLQLALQTPANLGIHQEAHCWIMNTLYCILSVQKLTEIVTVLLSTVYWSYKYQLYQHILLRICVHLREGKRHFKTFTNMFSTHRRALKCIVIPGINLFFPVPYMFHINFQMLCLSNFEYAVYFLLREIFQLWVNVTYFQVPHLIFYLFF